MCQYFNDLHNSVNQYFPNDQFTMLQNHTSKRPIHSTSKPVDFNMSIKISLIWFQIPYYN